jgi:polyisoprenoid-binding protein YceI
LVSALGVFGCASTNPTIATSAVAQTVQNPSNVSAAAIITSQPSGTYAVEPTHTSLVWRVPHFGLSNYTARLTTISGTIEFNAANPTQSVVNINVDPTSVSTTLPNFDTEIENQAFNSDQFPTINFVSTNLTMTGPKTGTMNGNLTFHGQTKPVSLEVTFNGANVNPFSQRNTLGFSAHGKIKRSDFGVTKWLPFVGDDVEIIVEAEFAKQ